MSGTRALPLLLLLAACGGDNTLEFGDTAELDDTEGGDAGDAFTMRVDGLGLAPAGTGFNLDTHDTTAPSDPIGCGKVDGPGGVDNALAGIAQTAAGFGFDLGASIESSVTSGDLVIDITVSGYHGPNDDLVRVDVVADDREVASGIEGRVEDDIVFVTIPTLPLSGDVDGTTFEVTLRQVRLGLPLAGAPADVTVTDGMLGGGVTWDEPGDNDLRGLVLANLPSWVEGMARNALDLQPPSGTGACDAISAALMVDASAQ